MPKKRRHGTPRTLPVRTVQREDGSLALEVGGVTQSLRAPVSEPDAPGPQSGYWGLMLPSVCPRRALLLGLGGGSIAALLHERCPHAQITGIERDPIVLAVARADFGLDDLRNLTIVQADAFTWVEEHWPDGSSPIERTERFDLIAVDLFEGGRLVAGTLATQFLRRLVALLAPGGVATINLMRTGRTNEQIHRLQRVFAIQRQLSLRGNLVLHLTPLPPSATQTE